MGSVSSRILQILFFPPKVLGNCPGFIPEFCGVHMTITITGNLSGTTYTVLTTSVLGPNANWTAIATNVTADATGSAVFVDTNAVPTFVSRFYRALVQ
jgi:hypothetical protein